MPAWSVDGMDVLAVADAAHHAVDAFEAAPAPTSWKGRPIASGRIRCSTPSCTAPRKRSPSGWNRPDRALRREDGTDRTARTQAIEEEVEAEIADAVEIAQRARWSRSRT